MFTGAGVVVLCLVRDKVHVYWGGRPYVLGWPSWFFVLSEIRSMCTGAALVVLCLV